jgi:hypothetical protein
VVAVGAATAVPLGNNVTARTPHDLLAEAEAIFRRRDSSFEFREIPIELMLLGSDRIELATDESAP